MSDTDAKRSVRKIQAILDPYCLFAVTINPESRVSVVEGPGHGQPTRRWRRSSEKGVDAEGWRCSDKVLTRRELRRNSRRKAPTAAPLYMRGHGGGSIR